MAINDKISPIPTEVLEEGFKWRNWFFLLTEKVNSMKVLSGTGTPEGVVVAGIGTLYTRTDGGASTTLYVKESGTSSTGWIAK